MTQKRENDCIIKVDCSILLRHGLALTSNPQASECFLLRTLIYLEQIVYKPLTSFQLKLLKLDRDEKDNLIQRTTGYLSEPETIQDTRHCPLNNAQCTN